MSIFDAKKEQFRGSTTDFPLEIKLGSGAFVVKVRKAGYKLITDKMEVRDGVDVTVEPSSRYTPVLLIMMPLQ